jgi:hypothetical protein
MSAKTTNKRFLARFISLFLLSVNYVRFGETLGGSHADKKTDKETSASSLAARLAYKTAGMF